MSPMETIDMAIEPISGRNIMIGRDYSNLQSRLLVY